MWCEFDPSTGRFTFTSPDIPGVSIEGATACVRYRLGDGRTRLVKLEGQASSIQADSLSDLHGSGRQISITNLRDNLKLTYRVNQYADQPFLLLQLALCNLSREPISVQDITLFRAGKGFGGRVLVSRHEQPLSFFKVGWHGWDYAGLRTHRQRNASTLLGIITDPSYTNPATPRPSRRGDFWSEGWGILVGEEAALVTGFVSTARQFGQVYASTRPGQETLELITQADDVRLDPGDEFESEWGYVQFVPFPSPEPTAEFVQAVARQMRSRVPSLPPPPMWTHWYHFYQNITEDLFIENLDTIANNQASVPYQIVQLDDGYQSAWGDWTTCNAKFPHGLDFLASRVKEKGFTPGLWLAPFIAQPNSNIAREHPDWLVKNQHGRPANAGFFYSFFGHALDTSHPAVLEHVRDLMETIAHRWGFGMLKADFLYAAALPGRRYNPKLTRAQCLRLGLEAIRQGLGEETFLLGCGCPFGPAIGVVDAMRIGPDTAPSWTPFFNWLPWAGPLIKGEVSMPSLRNAIRHTLNLSTLHQRWWWNDPDCLLVRDQQTSLTEVEMLSNVSLVGLSGGMLVSSDDLRRLNPARFKLVSLLVPNLGVRGLPIDLLEHEMPELYQLKLQAAGQVWQDVALFNWSDHQAGIRLRFDRLGFAPGNPLHVFDFWEKRYTLVTDGELAYADIPAHGCKLLRVCAKGVAPQVVGDTLHITQGAELASFFVEGGRLVIETVDMERWVEGELWLSFSSEPKMATCNQKKLFVEKRGDDIYTLTLQFERKGKIEVWL